MIMIEPSKLLHSLDLTVSGGKFNAIVESEKYDTLTVNELFSKLKSAEVDRGMTAKLEGPTDSHSLALVGDSKGKANTNPSTRMFSLSSLMSMPDEEFYVLGEDELALLTRRFEWLHENQVNMRRNTRTCFQCGKPRHFVADCPEKVENKDGYKPIQERMASTDRGVTTRARTRTSTRMSDDRGRRRAEARPERWLERATSTPVPRTPPRAQAAVKMKVIVARSGSHPRT
jgi:hypothetical protein